MQCGVDGYEWDRRKVASNPAKHTVDFVDVALSVEVPYALTAPDPDAEGDERFVSLAVDPTGQVLITLYSTCRPQLTNHSCSKG